MTNFYTPVAHADLDNGAYVVVRHEYTEDDGCGESTAYWAVREPGDYSKGPDVDGYAPWMASRSFSLFGGQPVRVYSRDDIAGLRLLLDEIDKWYEAREAHDESE